MVEEMSSVERETQVATTLPNAYVDMQHTPLYYRFNLSCEACMVFNKTGLPMGMKEIAPLRGFV